MRRALGVRLLVWFVAVALVAATCDDYAPVGTSATSVLIIRRFPPRRPFRGLSVRTWRARHGPTRSGVRTGG